MVDIILLTLPGLETITPITALATLKAAVEEKGFKAKCIDYNIELWHKVKPEIRDCWLESNMTLERNETMDPFWENELHPLMINELERLRELNPRWIGINLFITKQIRLGVKYITFFKKHLPDVKIVVGGGGSLVVGPKWVQENFTDASVTSEGELALIEILKGNLDYPGINGRATVQLDDLNFIPAPDYRDYNLSLYGNDPDIKTGTDILYISGSRGCVRRCSFCDIGNFWPKYRYRNGISIAEEMMLQKTRHNIDYFMFTDSLINGSIKQLKNMCTTLLEYYKDGTMQPIKWNGQAIVRPIKQMPEEVWAMMAESGCKFLALGVESGSQNVRTHMKKHFSNEDLDFAMKMADKYRIKLAVLMIIGYPTETEQDFQDTLDFFTRHAHMRDLINIQLGRTLNLSEFMPLWDQRGDLKVEFYNDEYNMEQWRIGDFDKKERLKRWIRAYEHLQKINLPTNIHNYLHFKKELEGMGITGFPSMGPTAII
jgi:anaerobic magnesium-protoporphyrin IX monomethyl ester cyclase